MTKKESRNDNTARDSQGSSSRDDLNELLGDDGLSGAVEGEGQLVNHLSWRRRRRRSPSVNVKR